MTTRLVLTMIVRNEAKIIERCIAAALPHIDGYVIVDTGSTDDTVEKIKTAAATIPGMVGTDTWVNFGVNRTRSAELAREWVLQKRWPLGETYLLLLDADMVLRATPEFTRARLTAPHYRIIQRDPTLRYYNTRLVRLSHRWRSVGVTHEFWAPTPDCQAEHVEFAWVEDLGDGGSKDNKTARDIALLQQGLVDEPENGRYMFYLAQSYCDVRDYEASATWYRKRIATGGWEEEVWYSAYKLGLVSWELRGRWQEWLGLWRGFDGLVRFLTGGVSGAVEPLPEPVPSPWEAAPGLLLEAYQRRPTRAEPLAALARIYREQGKNHLAYTMARQALDIPFPKDDTLFVDEPANRRAALDEVAITAYYLDKKDEGRRACETLLGSREHPAWFHDHVAKHVSFYVQPLGPKATRSGDFTVSGVIRSASGPFFGAETPNTTTYNPSNPTIVALPDGRYLANIRLVNYYHERGRVFAPKDADGVVRTRNVIQVWDPATGAPRSEVESRALLPEEWDHTTMVRGLEDQRWAAHEGRIWLTFTCFNIPGKGGMPQVALGRVTEAEDGIEAVRALQYAGSGRYEKNWLPWSRPEGLCLVYGYDPFRVLKVDTDTGECRVLSEVTPPFATARWRGSAAPVRTPTGKYVGVVHETAWFHGERASDQRTVYMHRFFECTETELTRRSPLFTIDHAGVEYVAGLARYGDDRYILTHSVEESSAHWKEFTWDTIDALLNGG